MYLAQRVSARTALAPVVSSAVVMVTASVAVLVLAAATAPAALLQVLAAVAVAGLLGVRLSAGRARRWWAKPASRARRTPPRA